MHILAFIGDTQTLTTFNLFYPLININSIDPFDLFWEAWNIIVCPFTFIEKTDKTHSE